LTLIHFEGEFYILPDWNLLYFYLVGPFGGFIENGRVTLLPYLCNSQPMFYTGSARTWLIRVMGMCEVAVLRRTVRKKRLHIEHSTERRGRKYA